MFNMLLSLNIYFRQTLHRIKLLPRTNQLNCSKASPS